MKINRMYIRSLLTTLKKNIFSDKEGGKHGGIINLSFRNIIIIHRIHYF